MVDAEIFERRFRTYLLDNVELEEIAGGFRWTEGPVWMGDWNALLFQDLPRNRTIRWSETEGISVYREPSGFANGQARDREGRLLACSHQRRCIFRTEHDGSVTRLIAEANGKALNAPNDLVVKSDGSIWFTDPLYGIANDYEGGIQPSAQPPAVYRFDPGSGDIRAVATDFDGPNGIAFSPDESRLYIAETGDATSDAPKRHIRVFNVSAHGALSGGEIFHIISPGYCDGMKLDEDGNIWSSAADGVHCISPEGDLLGKIRIPCRVANLAWGGVHRNRLFLCASQRVYALFLNRRGVALT
jgi:gluconolactonase